MDELELLRRRYERERLARKAAESFAEAKTREQYETNQALQRLAAIRARAVGYSEASRQMPR